MCDAIVEQPIVDVLSATARALIFKKARLVIIPACIASDYIFLRSRVREDREHWEHTENL
jgi:hypothetical protein